MAFPREVPRRARVDNFLSPRLLARRRCNTSPLFRPGRPRARLASRASACAATRRWQSRWGPRNSVPIAARLHALADPIHQPADRGHLCRARLSGQPPPPLFVFPAKLFTHHLLQLRDANRDTSRSLSNINTDRPAAPALFDVISLLAVLLSLSLLPLTRGFLCLVPWHAW